MNKSNIKWGIINLKGCNNSSGYFVHIDYINTNKSIRIFNVKPNYWQKILMFFLYDFIWIKNY